MIYGIISDTHNHDWSAFSKQLSNGVNSRLQIILDETWRAAKAVKDAGGDALIHTGDLFHVRGKVSPSVLNPTLETYKRITEELGLKVYIIAGNHDLQGKESDDLGNAASSLREVGCEVINQPTLINDFLFVPWISSVEELKDLLEKQAERKLVHPEVVDVFIHAPVDEVLPHIPSHGLTPEFLGDLGFNQVFSGHYHNHRDLDNGVYSVGALTHQTWGDIGSKAGFLIVKGSEVIHYPSNAPEFLDLTECEPEEFPDLCANNYVRMKVKDASISEIEELRETLFELGAEGVQIMPIKTSSVVERDLDAAETPELGSLEKGIEDWVDSSEFKHKTAAKKAALEILSEVESV